MKIFELKRLRSDENLRQSDIATMFNCGQSNISAIEKGSRGLEDYQRDILIKKFGEEKIKKYEREVNVLSPIEDKIQYEQSISEKRLKDKIFPESVVNKLDTLEAIRMEQQKATSEALAKALEEIAELRKQLSELIRTNQKLTDKLISLINL